mmetsp:Transcript_8308/g.23641  ORF Transcript_8308/g.23641 Transcript_8308/m.23641 type:complete len:104 (+) Transcript_8308:322-633(+)
MRHPPSVCTRCVGHISRHAVDHSGQKRVFRNTHTQHHSTSIIYLPLCKAPAHRHTERERRTKPVKARSEHIDPPVIDVCLSVHFPLCASLSPHGNPKAPTPCG